jgi:hypothetical protein
VWRWAVEPSGDPEVETTAHNLRALASGLIVIVRTTVRPGALADGG